MSAVHGRPTALELLEAVREHLTDVLLPALADRAPDLVYGLRVSAGALAVVEREVAVGETDELAHEARYDELGLADDADLAARLRARAVPAAQLPAVRAALLADVEARLRVSRPAYLAAP